MDQASPSAPDERRPRWWPFESADRSEVTAPESTPGDTAAQHPPAAAGATGAHGTDADGNGSNGSNGRNGANGSRASDAGSDGAIRGTPVKGRSRASSGGSPLAEPAEPAEPARVPAGVLEAMRLQVADFAEFAHRSRVPSLPDLLALGSGGGITAEVVRTIAAELTSSEAAPGLGSDLQNVTDALMLALVAPRQPGQLSERQFESFVTVRGRLVVDVSMAAVAAAAPITRLVRVPAPAPAVGPRADADAAAPADGPASGPRAAVIVGSAAAIAGERLYLSPESLMAWTRRKVFRLCSSADDPQTAGSAIRAARDLEIVVLLDQSLGGGLWLDVDPDTGQPAAALAIELSASPTASRFTHVPLLDTPQLLTLPARRASG